MDSISVSVVPLVLQCFPLFESLAQVNINEHINWPGRAEWVTGRTFAHELGHNLGMQ